MDKKIKILILTLLLLLNISSIACAEVDKQYEMYKSTITKIEEVSEESMPIYHIEAKVKEGTYKNSLVTFEHMPIEGSTLDINFKIGMDILVNLQIVDEEIVGVGFVDVYRMDAIKILVVIFLLLLIIFGGFKGIRSAFSLVITFLLIIFCLIPLLINGFNPILATIIVSSITILINFLLISGFSKKSFCAIVGTISGTIIAGGLAFFFGNYMALTGISDENVQFLISHTDIYLDYRGLLFSGIIIGTMGAVMDVAMSIVSFIFEIKEKYPTTPAVSLLKSGFSVGKDIMATMTNTLILAYAGASLPLLILIVSDHSSLMSTINMEIIAEEIIRSLCGSIGLILAIPVSSVIAAMKS